MTSIDYRLFIFTSLIRRVQGNEWPYSLELCSQIWQVQGVGNSQYSHCRRKIDNHAIRKLDTITVSLLNFNLI